MTRRQRQGRGGKDHHGCGNAKCGVCSPGRELLGITRQEKAAKWEESEWDFEKRCSLCRQFGLGYCGMKCEASRTWLLYDD